ncbi:MAG: hypothetical protein IPJ60_14285 [Sphingobacteriaceae bacterium]|nr:hypothetical protein [Sphingobacteriaceae bacterium]
MINSKRTDLTARVYDVNGKLVLVCEKWRLVRLKRAKCRKIKSWLVPRSNNRK